MPATAFDVVKHRTLSLRCRCGQWHASAFPTGVTEAAQYGPNVRALGVHLTQRKMLPFARAAKLLRDIHGLAVSPGTLVAWVGQARTTSVLSTDESGLRVDSKLHWLHVAASDTLMWYGAHPKRGIKTITAHGIPPGRTGALVHDCWARAIRNRL